MLPPPNVMTWGGVSIIGSAADAAKNAVRKFWTRSSRLTINKIVAVEFFPMGQNFTKMNRLELALLLNLLKGINQALGLFVAIITSIAFVWSVL